jgi:hypothetical protein
MQKKNSMLDYWCDRENNENCLTKVMLELSFWTVSQDFVNVIIKYEEVHLMKEYLLQILYQKEKSI